MSVNFVHFLGNLRRKRYYHLRNNINKFGLRALTDKPTSEVFLQSRRRADK